MTRVLLINPPSPEQLGAPLLGLQYVAAPLVARGCEVRVIDAAAREFRGDLDWIAGQAEEFRPEIIGVGLYTRWVWHAYRLVERLAGIPALLVAGGPHATVRPDETLHQGFAVAVIGEAEETLPLLVDYVEGKTPLAGVAGVRFTDDTGAIRSGPPPQAIADLDAIPFPHTTEHLFDPAWYSSDGSVRSPGGILTSRGCPARCTFCANYVTGRRFRYRSARNVADELNANHAAFALSFFPFWDDAITADIRRLYELCDSFERDVDFSLGWSAITRATMVNREVLQRMKRAGCVAVNFGVESGDDAILRAIRKGITTGHVLRALEWAKEAELTTICNFMVGFPQETPASVERTLRFIERIAPMVDIFNVFGVLVPFPGTPLYDDYHERYGFSDWWLREEASHYVPPPRGAETDLLCGYYADDLNLQLDFFHYSAEMKPLMRACMKTRVEHNLRKYGMGVVA